MSNNVLEVIELKSGKWNIIDTLGFGGQGEVYIAENGKEKCAIKKLSKDDPNISKKRKNIKNLISLQRGLYDKMKNNKDYTFTFPLEYKQVDGVDIYRMNLAAGKDLEYWIQSGLFDQYSLHEKLEVIWKINEAFLFLSKDFLCYQDIQLRNVFYDPISKMVTVIDTENTAPANEVETSEGKRGSSAFLQGTGFFMAPEVGAGIKSAATKASDYYAMAVLYYCILTGSENSPYHGRIMYENSPLPMSMKEAFELAEDDEDYADFLTFIFDKDNRVNSLEDFYQEAKNKFTSESSKKLLNHLQRIIENWNSLPKSIQKLLSSTFKNPLEKESYSNRPRPDNWRRYLRDLLNKQEIEKVE